MLNCFSGVCTLTSSHKVEGDMLFIVGKNGDDVPTLCFVGKQRTTIEKWGKPGRVIAVSGAVRTKVENGKKDTYIEVAYSRFLDKMEGETVKAAPAPAPKAPAAPKAKAPAKAKAAKAVDAAPAAHVDDSLPW